MWSGLYPHLCEGSSLGVRPITEVNVEICKTKWKQHATKQRHRVKHTLSSLCVVVPRLPHTRRLSSAGSPSAGVLQEHVHYVYQCVNSVFMPSAPKVFDLMCKKNHSSCVWEQHILYILRSRFTHDAPSGASNGKDFFLSVTFTTCQRGCLQVKVSLKTLRFNKKNHKLNAPLLPTPTGDVSFSVMFAPLAAPSLFLFHAQINLSHFVQHWSHHLLSLTRFCKPLSPPHLEAILLLFFSSSISFSIRPALRYAATHYKRRCFAPSSYVVTSAEGWNNVLIGCGWHCSACCRIGAMHKIWAWQSAVYQWDWWCCEDRLSVHQDRYQIILMQSIWISFLLIDQNWLQTFE